MKHSDRLIQFSLAPVVFKRGCAPAYSKDRILQEKNQQHPDSVPVEIVRASKQTSQRFLFSEWPRPIAGSPRADRAMDVQLASEYPPRYARLPSERVQVSPLTKNYRTQSSTNKVR